MECKIITISNHKGGVGKTTTAINLSSGISRIEKNSGEKYKVLLMDLDPQSNATNTIFDSKRIDYKKSASIIDVFDGRNISDCIYPSRVRNLDVLPSHINLFDTEFKIANSPSAVSGLKSAIEKSDIRSVYDYIIIDTPPNLGPFMINSFSASDYYILVVDSESSYSLDGIKTLESRIDEIKRVINPELKLLGHLTTMFDGRNSTCKFMLKEMKVAFSESLFNSVIRRNTDLAKANTEGKSIFQFDLSKNGAIDYANLSKEVLERLNV